MSPDSLHRSPLAPGYPDEPPMMEFGGWEMPRDFGGIVEEHRAVRSSVGLFDLSHMGRIIVQGPAASSQLQRLFTRGLEDDASAGRAFYGFFCHRDGGCLDDAILYVREAEEVWVVANASNRELIHDWIQEGVAAHVEDRTDESVLLAVQGPRARATLEELRAPDLPKRPFRASWERGGMVATTGYTGEPGGEYWLPVDTGRELFEKLRDAGVVLCGLGARDTLRLEQGYPLHGHELGPDIDPLTAGLDRFIDWDHDFLGRSALEAIRQRGPERRLTGLVARDRRPPRRGYEVRREGGDPVGSVTSGRFSPSLEVGIGLALIDADVPEEAALEVRIRDRWYPVEQKLPPLVG